VKPNILVLLADQLRASSVGYAGEEPVATPHLDRMAKESANFTTAVSLLPVCTSYRGSLITGRTPLSTGLVLNDIPLSTSEQSLGVVLKKAGYDTAYVGKWHLNGKDRKSWVPPGARRQGFDYWAAANFDHNYHKSVYFEGDSPEPKTWEGFDAESQTAKAIDYLRTRKGEKPFCLVLSWGPPHHPYRVVPKKYLDLYDPNELTPRVNCPNPPREDLWGYYAQTTLIDEMVGRILAEIARLNLAEDTIVMFTSDHGDMHGSQGVFKKQWPWDESIKVPFLLRYPRKVRPGSRFAFPVSVIDVMPTLLGLAEVPVPACVEGLDLSAWIAGSRHDAPASALLMNPCPFSVGDPRSPDQVPAFHGMRMEYRGLRTERYTYVRTIDKPWLLYDNYNDPYQLENLIDDPRRRALAGELEEDMQMHMARIGDRFLPKEEYYRTYGLEVDHRGKVKGIVENPYDRRG
jgi:arylsulfatase A-like enzyme